MRCSAIDRSGNQCSREAVGRHGWCWKHSSMRRVSVKAVLRRWCGISVCGLAVLVLVAWVTSMQHLFVAGALLLLTSLLIASWQEWVLSLVRR